MSSIGLLDKKNKSLIKFTIVDKFTVKKGYRSLKKNCRKCMTNLIRKEG